jgi:hypothetical protein
VLGALLSEIEACLRFFKVSERLKNPNTDTVHVMEDILLGGRCKYKKSPPLFWGDFVLHRPRRSTTVRVGIAEFFSRKISVMTINLSKTPLKSI